MAFKHIDRLNKIVSQQKDIGYRHTNHNHKPKPINNIKHAKNAKKNRQTDRQRDKDREKEIEKEKEGWKRKKETDRKKDKQKDVNNT